MKLRVISFALALIFTNIPDARAETNTVTATMTVIGTYSESSSDSLPVGLKRSNYNFSWAKNDCISHMRWPGSRLEFFAYVEYASGYSSKASKTKLSTKVSEYRWEVDEYGEDSVFFKVTCKQTVKLKLNKASNNYKFCFVGSDCSFSYTKDFLAANNWKVKITRTLEDRGEVLRISPLPDPSVYSPGLFNIPASWKWAKLGDVVEFVNGFAFRSDEYTISGVGVVRMSDLKSGQIIPDHMKYVSLDRLSSLAESFQVKPGDIVMGMTGATLGKPCVNRTTVTFLLNQRIGKFVPKEINPEYLLLVLSYLEKSFMNLSFGTGVNNLSTQQIKDSLIPLPPDHEQRKIVETVSALFSICDSLETEILHAQQISQKFVRSIVSTSI